VCRLVCESDTCAETAVCIGRDHQPKCICPPGTTGNAYIECTGMWKDLFLLKRMVLCKLWLSRVCLVTSFLPQLSHLFLSTLWPLLFILLVHYFSDHFSVSKVWYQSPAVCLILYSILSQAFNGKSLLVSINAFDCASPFMIHCCISCY
jgi:hypothetical protein